jgi:hypothetical protein
MRRFACLFLLLCSGFVFSQTLPQWRVVSARRVIGATSPKGPVTLFTAQGISLYRATEFISGFSKSIQNAGWTLVISWVDQSSGNINQLACGVVFNNGFYPSCSQPPTPFSPLAGTPVTLEVDENGDPVGARYSAIMTIEQLATN